MPIRLLIYIQLEKLSINHYFRKLHNSFKQMRMPKENIIWLFQKY